jgi:hypothetical protein
MKDEAQPLARLSRRSPSGGTGIAKPIFDEKDAIFAVLYFDKLERELGHEQ